MDIFITCRTGSSRLKNKFQKKLKNEDSLDFVINRAIIFKKYYKKINNIIITTGPQKKNQVLEKYAKKNKIKIVYGSEENMSKRYNKVIKKYKTVNFIRMTADNPFFCFRKLLKLSENHLKNKNIYTYNKDLCTGTSFDIVNYKFIEYICSKNYKFSAYLTHYAEILKGNNKKIKKYNITTTNEISKIRLTLDTQKDLKMMNYLLNIFDLSSNNFKLSKILDYLNNNQIPKNISNASVMAKNNDKYFNKIKNEINFQHL